MAEFQFSYESIVANLHSLSPQPSESRLRRLEYSIDPDRQCFDLVELHLNLPNQQTRVLVFRQVWPNWTRAEDLILPQPLGQGILVVSLQKYGWEHPIVVVADDENYQTMFGAKSVEQVAI